MHRRGAEQSGRAARAPGDDIPLGALVSGNRGRLVRRRVEMSDSSAEALRDSTLPWPCLFDLQLLNTIMPRVSLGYW